MSTYIRWEFYGHNGDAKAEPLTSKQIECLVALDEYDLEGMNWGQDYLFGWGETESNLAYDRIEEALTKFAELHPDVTIKVLAYYETEPAPYGFLLENGECIPFTGQIKYYRDDNGGEVVI